MWTGEGKAMRYLLGIDLGTTGLKAVIFDLGGRPLGKGFAANRYLPGPPGWAEQDPRAWWNGCCVAIQAALAEAQVDPADIAGVGVCGFHHCPVFLDADGEPARPTIVTHDSRLGESLADLQQSGTLDQIIEISGSRVMTGHFPPIYHLVQRSDRKALDRTRWILLAKDYIRYKLTGEIGTDICDATGTNLVAMPGHEWSDLLCELVGVPQEKLPDIGDSSQVFGEVSKEAAQASGLKAGTPVVYGGGDSHCALVGLGVIGSGEAGLLLGTNSTLRASFGGFVKLPEQTVWMQQHVVPGRYTVSASSMAGSSILDWFKDLCFGEDLARGNAEVYRELESLAAGVQPGCDGLLFHPYLYGERSPFYNPQARGSFLALAHWHRKGHLVRSVMEGIAFTIGNCFEVIEVIARGRNESIQTIRTGEGGGSRLGAWRQIICDVLGIPLEVVKVEEPGCLGAAIVAGVGVAEYQDIQAAVGKTTHMGSLTAPDAQNTALYKERRIVFNETYRLLEPVLYRQTDQEERG
jgi:xylulokinase